MQLALEALELGPHPAAQEGVERRKRFVQQQRRRVGHQGAGQRHALLLPAR